ncbi:MAG: aldehyde:ferredoxin oxidoreductase [Firmicutes bacterium]|nr:aldehyde:ferredoxin oxidoreductase [Bacillota bacterium]HOB35182.1 aldehyde ferredoxin oxidoreductase C-terminal domain-containing protein [Bacillota bacterium]HPZ90423.1 aldehyde ferredoxin oxidoreductase C-terminal domain-containing protein [Bacillota bacterium]HQE01663.1 aldehyde ferredoxin oxidoreductase C-terminal domain-containing protein [Bacillota bacterium]
MACTNCKTRPVKLHEFSFEPRKLHRGYADRSLYVNLSTNEIKVKPIPEEMKKKFIGGRGYGMKYLWDAVTPDTKWNSPENELIIAQGPIGGITQYPGAGKSYVVTISPLTGLPVDSNVGGYFGPLFKFCGFDALEIQGKAEKDVIIFIDGDNHKVTIEEAPADMDTNSHILAETLTEMYADSEEDKRNVSVVSAGVAAEHTRFGILNFSYYDVRRKKCKLKQAGRGGTGTVLRDKKVKAIVVKKSGIKGDLNDPHDLDTIIKLGIKLHKEIHDNDELQCNMRVHGTTQLVDAMNAHDLLPVNNFQYGEHPEAPRLGKESFEKLFDLGKPDGCWYGCTLACAHALANFEIKTGPYKGQKVFTDGPEYETLAGCGSNCGIFDPIALVETNFYCDTYAIDTISFGTTCAFLMECYERGIINKEITGGLELRFGNWEAQMELLHQMARGEGFGVVAGQGIHRLKKLFVEKYGADKDFLEDIGMEMKGLEFSEYISKESLAQQAGYGTANKGPQHDENWLIFMDMIRNQMPTFEDKAEALHYFPLFRTWFSIVGLCKLPWNDIMPADNHLTDEPAKVPEHVDNYVALFTAVTGQPFSKEEMLRQSERVYNFQKVFNLRMGKGTREYDNPPYRAVGPVTVEEYESRRERYDKQLREKAGVDPEGMTVEEKIQALRKYREEQYQGLLDVVYQRRGWTPNAIPTIEKLEELGIAYPEIVEVVKRFL